VISLGCWLGIVQPRHPRDRAAFAPAEMDREVGYQRTCGHVARPPAPQQRCAEPERSEFDRVEAGLDGSEGIPFFVLRHHSPATHWQALRVRKHTCGTCRGTWHQAGARGRGRGRGRATFTLNQRVKSGDQSAFAACARVGNPGRAPEPSLARVGRAMRAAVQHMRSREILASGLRPTKRLRVEQPPVQPWTRWLQSVEPAWMTWSSWAAEIAKRC
jgi:hypothetical protein